MKWSNKINQTALPCNKSSDPPKLQYERFAYPKNPIKNSGRIHRADIDLQNKYSTLQEVNSEAMEGQVVEADVHKPDNTSQSTASSRTFPLRNLSPRTKKRRLLVLADSQGKDIYRHLQPLHEDFQVFVLAKPGATLKQVIKDGKAFFKDFTLQDFIICIAGTNDLGKNEPSQLTVHAGLKELLSANINTNIIVNEIPYRYDTSEFNDRIFFLNQKLRNTVVNYRGKNSTLVCATNHLLGRSHFTRHGLHFNRQGKRILGNFYVQRIRQKITAQRDERTGSIARRPLRSNLPELYPSPHGDLDAIEVDSIPAIPPPVSQSARRDQTRVDGHDPETYADAVKGLKKLGGSCPAPSYTTPRPPQKDVTSCIQPF